MLRVVRFGEADELPPATRVDEDERDARGGEARGPEPRAVAGRERGRDTLAGTCVLLLQVGERDRRQMLEELKQRRDLVASPCPLADARPEDRRRVDRDAGAGRRVDGEGRERGGQGRAGA